MPWFLVAALFIGFLGALLLLAPKPKTENARPQGLNDLRFPRAEEGSPVPLLLGTERIRGPNTIWVGDFKAKPIKKKQKTGLFSSKKVTVGYEYFIGLDLALALGPCVLKRIWIDKEEVWSGSASVDGTAIAINKPKLFGGKEKGGGFMGTLRYYTGSQTQGANAYVQGKVGGVIPAYRSTAHIVLEHCNIGESNTLRAMSFELQRLSDGLSMGATSVIGGFDMNPMEMLYQLLTLKRGGLNVPINLLDLDTFKACSTTLFNENNGMSLVVSRPNDGKDVCGEVVRQIDALLYQEPALNVIVPKLIRNDYVIADLPVFNKSNVLGVRDFKAKLWEDTLNQVRVVYPSREKKYENAAAIVQDLANIGAQGRIRSTTLQFPGIHVSQLGVEVATRELSQASVPLISASLEMNRDGMDLRPGECFVWSWPDYKLASIVMRVQKFDLGSLTDNRIAVDCIQDEFALAATVFGEGTGVGSDSGAGVVVPANPATSRKLLEAPYFFANAAGIELPSGTSLILTAVEAPADADSYAVYVSDNGGTSYAEAESGMSFGVVGTLGGAITASQDLDDGTIASISVTVSDPDDLAAVTAAEALAGEGMLLIDNELFTYQGYANAANVLTLSTVRRALLDTSPQAHAIGAKVYFLSGNNVIDDPYGETATLRVKVLPETYNDILDEATAPYDSITLNKRASRPLRPANVKWNGGTANAPPASAVGSLTLTWANRSRLSGVVRSIVDNTNEYEPGQQTVLRWRKNAGAWNVVTIAPGIATYTFNPAAVAGDTFDYELYATRDGLDSLSKWAGTAGAGAATGSTGGESGAPAPTDGNPAYTAPPDALSLVFPFGENVGTYPIDLPITYPINIPAGLAGTNGDHRTNPTAAATFTLKKNGAAVGTIAISAAGAYTLTAASAIALVAGDTLTCEPPAVADATLKGVTITVAGTRG